MNNNQDINKDDNHHRERRSSIFSDQIIKRLNNNNNNIDVTNESSRKNCSDNSNSPTRRRMSSSRLIISNSFESLNSNNDSLDRRMVDSSESLNRSSHESRKKRNRQGLDESVHSLHSVDSYDKGRMGSTKFSSRKSDDGDNQLVNSRLAFSNADRRLESKVVTSSSIHNKEKVKKREFTCYEIYKVIINPISCDSDIYKYWNLFIIFLALITAIYTPYRISFETDTTTLWYLTLYGFELCFDLIFIINMLLHAFHFYRPASLSSYNNEDGFAFRSEIFLSYVSKGNGKRFIVDVISSIPWDYMASTNSQYNLSLKFGLGIIRTVRLFWVAEYFYLCETDIKLPFFTLRVIKLLTFLLLESHWFACVFYFVGLTEPNYETSWLHYVAENKHLPESSIQRYLLSLYWSWVTTATLGYGDITPQSNREYVVVIFYTAFNILFSAFIVANMTSLVSYESEKTRIFRQKYSALEKFVRVNVIPKDIRNAMQAHMQLQFSVDDEHLEILDEIPDHLKTRCQHVMYRPIIESCIFNELVSDSFIDHLSCSLQLQVIMPHNDVIVQDDASTAMYFILSGFAETIHSSIMESTVINDDESELKRRNSFSDLLKARGDRDSVLSTENKSNSKNYVVNSLGIGSTVGEVSFIFNILQPFTVRTSRICRLLMLQKDVWLKRLEISYPIDSTLFKRSCFNHIVDSIKQFREPGYTFTSSKVVDTEIMEIYDDLEKELSYSEAQWEHDTVSEICLAAASDNIVAIKKILMCGISVNACDYDKRNALMVAASKGSINAVQFLLSKGADYGLVDAFGNTALHEAVQKGHDTCSSILYDCGARLSDSIDDFNAGSMMCTSISKGDHELLMRLLKYGLNPNSGDYDCRRALHVGSCKGDLRAVKILLDYGADGSALDNFGRSPLLEAVRGGHYSVAKLLFERGGRLGFLDSVDKDLELRTKSDEIWKCRILTSSELLHCVTRLDTKYLRWLLEFGADPNKAFDYDLRSPSHLAVCMNNIEVCTLLLEHKADFVSNNSKDRWGSTPLDEAKRNSTVSIIQNLIKINYSKETVDV